VDAQRRVDSGTKKVKTRERERERERERDLCSTRREQLNMKGWLQGF